MYVTYVILAIFWPLARFNCDVGANGTTETSDNNTSHENSTEIQESGVKTTTIAIDFTEVAETQLNLASRGLYGGSYYNPAAKNPKNVHYIHGAYQTPRKDYYKLQDFYRDDDTDATFDYYLAFGISKMTDQDFEYDDFHYYNHTINRTISEKETIPSDFVIACHPNATFLCPENTETVCLLNGTIYCMSKMNVVVPCSQYETSGCVNTVVPCVRACIEISNNFETVTLPCLATVVIIDVYEDKRGKTLSRVGGTFVIMDALEEKTRTFCIVVIVDPIYKQNEV